MRAVGSISAVVLALLGCAHDAYLTPVRGPDGTTWYAIDCGGVQTSCELRAGRACPGGYDLAGTEGHVESHFGAVGFRGNTPVYAGSSSYAGHMLIKCKAPAHERTCIDDSSCDPGERCVFAGSPIKTCSL